jgi:predicted DNA-binding protein (UPF0251 family)
MSGMKELTLTANEQKRLQVLNQVMAREVAVGDAANVLGLSERHTWRLLAEYRKEGAAALVHGNRGRPATNAIPDALRAQVLRLATTRYEGLNQTHFTEMLAEREELILARSTVRNILRVAGIASPRRRRPPRHRTRRERMPQEGMPLQLDGVIIDGCNTEGPHWSCGQAMRFEGEPRLAPRPNPPTSPGKTSPTRALLVPSPSKTTADRTAPQNSSPLSQTP